MILEQDVLLPKKESPGEVAELGTADRADRGPHSDPCPAVSHPEDDLPVGTSALYKSISLFFSLNHYNKSRYCSEGGKCPDHRWH